jgi:hypothetical protein
MRAADRKEGRCDDIAAAFFLPKNWESKDGNGQIQRRGPWRGPGGSTHRSGDGNDQPGDQGRLGAIGGGGIDEARCLEPSGDALHRTSTHA